MPPVVLDRFCDHPTLAIEFKSATLLPGRCFIHRSENLESLIPRLLAVISLVIFLLWSLLITSYNLEYAKEHHEQVLAQNGYAEVGYVVVLPIVVVD